MTSVNQISENQIRIAFACPWDRAQIWDMQGTLLYDVPYSVDYKFLAYVERNGLPEEENLKKIMRGVRYIFANDANEQFFVSLGSRFRKAKMIHLDAHLTQEEPEQRFQILHKYVSAQAPEKKQTKMPDMTVLTPWGEECTIAGRFVPRRPPRTARATAQ